MKFARVWRCWSCGRRLEDGTLLDCSSCSRWLEREIDGARSRSPLFDVEPIDIDRALERLLSALWNAQ